MVVLTGNADTDWKREDALLALAAVRRIRRTRNVPLVVITSDSAFVEDKLGDLEDVEIIVRSKPRIGLVDMVGPDDLFIGPAYVIHDATPTSMRRVSRSLTNANIAVIAGPHRLSISKGVTRYNVQSVTPPGL